VGYASEDGQYKLYGGLAYVKAEISLEDTTSKGTFLYLQIRGPNILFILSATGGGMN
jgi:hypothetical protein